MPAPASAEDNAISDEDIFELVDNPPANHVIEEGNGAEENSEINHLKKLNEEYKREIEKLKVENEKLRAVDQNSVESTDLVRTVTLSKGRGGKFGFDRTMNYIEEVFCRSPAKLRGMKQGDEIISINGVNVEGFTHKEIGDMLKNASGMTTFILRSKPAATIWTMLKSASDNENYHSTIDRVQSKMKDEKFRNNCISFFFSFICCLILFITNWMLFVIYANIAVTLVTAACYVSVCLLNKEERDKFLSTLKWIKSKMVELALFLCYADDTFAADGNDESANDPRYYTPERNPRTVTITSNETGCFGISRALASIRTVSPGSSAALQGLRRGDEIIAIDGTYATRWLSDSIQDLLRKGEKEGVMKLTVRYNPEILRANENKMRFFIIATAMIFIGSLVAIFMRFA